MNIKRTLLIVGISVAIALVWAQLFLFLRESGQLRVTYEKASAQLHGLEDENSSLENDKVFFSVPLNLLKVLRERFNYKKPGEHMIIVVPGSEQ